MAQFPWQLNGIDEAGYGPRLGPLVQACVQLRWNQAGPFAFDDWDAVEAQVDAANAAVQVQATGAGVAVGDSKKLYARGGAPALWRAVNALAGSCADKPEASARTGWPEWLRVDQEHHPEGEHASAGYEPAALQAAVEVAASVTAVPVGTDVPAADGPAQFTAAACCLFPGAFNAQLAARNKAEINWSLTQRLVRGANTAAGARASISVNASAALPTVWTLDRQGGRRFYGGLLGELFAPAYVQVVEESAARAIYRVTGGGHNAWVVVKVGGEAWSPATALASMVAKSLREAAMAQFNAHFSARYPTLEPTAGYPTDAERWRAALLELDPAQGRDWSRLWRAK